MRNCSEIIFTFTGTLPAARFPPPAKAQTVGLLREAGSGQRPEMWKLIKDNS